ncbi:esterase FE4-like [Epargyreus clarus]|uniref:esterase FE4-like n=1 Tax=Epargyreus clarus TaxID=520877 RepID=UPI003C309ECB
MSCKVKVTQGVLEGKVAKSHFGQTYFSFEGIPYAKPPVGQLRFRSPQEPENWSGVRDATKPGNKCAQINPYGNLVLEGSEDCLYLNVYTPKLPEKETAKLPVLFFVHGGRLIVGQGDYYRPDFLIRHDVILVTINYRLHILGFLCLNTPDIPGNAGMKDTIMALKWVKDNIEHFNGDPNNIVAFGESAGAGIVSSYLSSKMADGLITKIIAQSGNLLSDLFMVEEDEVAKARNITNIMGKKVTDQRTLAEYLTEAPLDELINAFVNAELSRPPSIINAYFLPVIEKQFAGIQRYFEESPHASLRNNRFKKIPVLTSISSHEGALFLQDDGQGNFYIEDDFQYFIPRFLSIKLGTPKAVKFANSLRKFYFKGEEPGKNRSDYINLVSDVYFGRDTAMFIEAISKYVNTYVCVFSYNGAMNTRVMKKLGIKGASHGDLAQYIFYKKSKIGLCKGKEKMVVDALTEAWCNFAKTGKPTWTNQEQEWLPYNTEKKLCLNVDDEIKLTRYPNFEKYEFWFDLMNEKSKL